jgi:hypothetical protein
MEAWRCGIVVAWIRRDQNMNYSAFLFIVCASWMFSTLSCLFDFQKRETFDLPRRGQEGGRHALSNFAVGHRSTDQIRVHQKALKLRSREAQSVYPFLQGRRRTKNYRISPTIMAKLKHRLLTAPRTKKEKRNGRKGGAKPKGVEKAQSKTTKKNKGTKNTEPTIPFDVYDDILLVGEGMSPSSHDPY